MNIMFCGHREVSDETAIRKWLWREVKACIKAGGRKFYFGGYGRFDEISADVVRAAKKEHPDIELIHVIPYPDRKTDSQIYDSSVYPPLENVPRRFAIVCRNRWMVDNSDIVIAYVSYGWGGAATTLKYAEKKKKRIVCFPDKNAN